MNKIQEAIEYKVNKLTDEELDSQIIELEQRTGQKVAPENKKEALINALEITFMERFSETIREFRERLL